jgi:CBS domain-containing protein
MADDTTARSGEQAPVPRPDAPVAEVMARDPITVDEKLTLRSLAAVLAEADVGAVLVAKPDGTVGVVSERDVVRALADDADPDLIWSADVMTEDVVQTRPEDPILVASARMLDHRIRHLVVTDDEGRVVGVVTARDLLRALAEDLLDRL